MQAMTVYLRPDSSFRGKRPPRSDTLFGSICWGYKLLFGETPLTVLLNDFKTESVPLLVSSMFRYTDKTLYLPKPYTKPYQPDKPPSSKAEIDALKKLRKKPTVRLDEFVEVIAGKKTEKDFYDKIFNDPRPKKKALTSFDTPHVTINRLTGSVEGSRFFYTEEYAPSAEVQEQAGLFFFVKCRADLVSDLKTVLYFLGDKGIGGGVSVGKGHFQIIKIADELPYQEPPEAEHVVTLSLTFPCEAIRSRLSESWYDIERRQGKIESMYVNVKHIWKDHLIMLKEGSTFPKNGQKFYGKNRIVREDDDKKDDDKLGFDVQHYGYAFTVNTKHVPKKAD